MYTATIASSRYVFPDLKTLLAKASPARSGDQLAGIAAASGEERVAAQYALADVPLANVLEQPVIPYESDEVTRLIVDTHDRAAFAPIASHGGRIARLAPLRRADGGKARRARARHHAGDGGGGRQDQRAQGLDGDGGEVFGGDALPRHHRAARPPVGAAAAQPPDRRSARHRREHPRRPPARGRRRRHRHQPRDRQYRARARAAVDARRGARQARHPDPDLRAGARDHDARAHRQGRAGRPRVPVDRGHRGREQELRHRPRAHRRGARGRAVASPRHPSATT